MIIAEVEEGEVEGGQSGGEWFGMEAGEKNLEVIVEKMAETTE